MSIASIRFLFLIKVLIIRLIHFYDVIIVTDLDSIIFWRKRNKNQLSRTENLDLHKTLLVFALD